MLPRRILAQLEILRDDPDPDVRADAINRLIYWVDPAITAAFQSALRDVDVRVRLAAIAAIRARHEKESLGALRKGLRDSDAEVRKATALALATFHDSEAIADLRPLLEDDATRNAALRALAAAGDTDSIEPLIAILSSDVLPTGELIATIENVAEVADPRLIMPIIELLNDAEDGVRQAAAIALGQMGHTAAFHPLVEVANDEEDEMLAQAAIVSLGRLKDERAIPVLFEFVTDGADDETRILGLEALLEVGAPITELLAAILEEDPSEWMRQAAAHALGKSGDPRAFDLLLAALGDASDMVQGAAATALADLGDTRAVEPLGEFVGVVKGGLRGLMGHQNVAARIEALQALLKFNDPRALPIIESWYKHGNAEMKFEAASALAQLGDERGIEYLLAVLGGNVLALANQAVGRLSKLTHPDAAEAVADWEDRHPYWRAEMEDDDDDD